MMWLLLAACGASWDVRDGDGDGISILEGDCDDANPDVAVGANQLWYPDADGDGFGDPDNPVMECTAPVGYVADGNDCDDTRLDVFIGADELCDGLDNDCDGEVDNNAIDPGVYFLDADGDGYGDPDITTASCDAPSGYVTDSSDCHDDDEYAYPGSHTTEVPGDGVDQDCDGLDACVDLSCDGWPDLVLGFQYDGSSFVQNIAVYLNTGSGLPASPLELPAERINDVTVADFNGDGYPDIAAANGTPLPGVTEGNPVYWGSASGFTGDDRTLLPGAGAEKLLAADLNGDGLPELVFANQRSLTDYVTESKIYWASASGFSEDDVTELTTSGASGVIAEDLDDDGALDLVFCNQRDNESDPYNVASTIFWGGDFSDSTRLDVTGCSGLDAADLDDDGLVDLVFASYRDGGSSESSSMIYWNDGDRFSTKTGTALPTLAAQSVQAADLNRDGYPEVIFGSQIDSVEGTITTSELHIYWGEPNRGLGEGSDDTLPANATLMPHITDLDGDGHLDLVAPGYAIDDDDYTPDSYVYWGSSTGPSVGDVTALQTDNAVHATSGDLDDDGLPELVFGSYYNGGVDFDTVSRVYGGTDDGYSDDDVQLLTTLGVWAEPIIVGR